MVIKATKKFERQFDKLPRGIQERFEERIALFAENPYHTTLHNHKLTGNRKGYRSINITGDYRVVYSEFDGFVFLREIGTHSQLYR